MFLLSVLCSEYYHFSIQLFMKRAVRKVEPCFERIFTFSIVLSQSPNPNAYGSQDGKKLLPSVPGTSKLFLSTCVMCYNRIKAKPILESICCFKVNLKCYTSNNAGCSILTLLHLISFSHPSNNPFKFILVSQNTLISTETKQSESKAKSIISGEPWVRCILKENFGLYFSGYSASFSIGRILDGVSGTNSFTP